MAQILSELTRQLQQRYPLEEARAIARRLLEEPPMELSTTQVFTAGLEELPVSKQILLGSMVDRLLQGEPLQYVMGHEYFCGLRLNVGPGVLIPRPETQDLVDWIVADERMKNAPQILDACTGSGCIAAALAEALPTAALWALDLSDAAISYAQQNTLFAQNRVQVLKADILQPLSGLPTLDILVSNPPYIPYEECVEMEENVKNWEPGMALFVPDDSPLKFYQALGLRGQELLRDGGALYVEINRRFGAETVALFQAQGYHQVELRNDRYNQPRMVKAVK